MGQLAAVITVSLSKQFHGVRIGVESLAPTSTVKYDYCIGAATEFLDPNNHKTTAAWETAADEIDRLIGVQCLPSVAQTVDRKTAFIYGDSPLSVHTKTDQLALNDQKLESKVEIGNFGGKCSRQQRVGDLGLQEPATALQHGHWSPRPRRAAPTF